VPIEFLGIAATNDGSETTPRSGPSFDREYTVRLGRAHEDLGWDRVLFAYGSGTPEPSAAAAYLLAHTERLVARALLDYVDLGVDIVSMRGYDLLGDAIDVGRCVLPIVREKVAERDAAAAPAEAVPA
jgi:alkanesulfonate monooxygenase SsuD/methylene tetrahydromethanopterin reductase-like flavin-dependent oxidoreductase (luciferase family)